MPIRKRFRDLVEFGPLRIRLQRFGRSNFAFYDIVVAQARFRLRGRKHDTLGTYCPHPTNQRYKHLTLHFARTKEWLAAGAEPSHMVARILSKAGLWPCPPSYAQRMTCLGRELDQMRDPDVSTAKLEG